MHYNTRVGTLYVVATPIGNLGDITLRAIETLKQCDLVVCEDTRVTGKLLHHLEIDTPMFAMNEFNEQERVYEVLGRILAGERVALVSDAGTPLVSDPGYLLISQARQKGVCVVPIPGSTAFVAALSAAGLPTTSFIFLGFLSKKDARRKAQLDSLYRGMQLFREGDIAPTVVLYESPVRLGALLGNIGEVFGDIEVVIARELTKMHEEFEKEHVFDLTQRYNSKGARGEICVLFNIPKS